MRASEWGTDFPKMVHYEFAGKYPARVDVMNLEYFRAGNSSIQLFCVMKTQWFRMFCSIIENTGTYALPKNLSHLSLMTRRSHVSLSVVS